MKRNKDPNRPKSGKIMRRDQVAKEEGPSKEGLWSENETQYALNLWLEGDSARTIESKGKKSGKCRRGVKSIEGKIERIKRGEDHIVLNKDRTKKDYHKKENAFIQGCRSKSRNSKHPPLTWEAIAELTGREASAVEQHWKEYLNSKKPCETSLTDVMNSIKEKEKSKMTKKSAKKKESNKPKLEFTSSSELYSILVAGIKLNLLDGEESDLEELVNEQINILFSYENGGEAILEMIIPILVEKVRRSLYS